MIYKLDSTFKSSVTMFIYNLNERVENSKCSASDRIKFRYGVMSNAHLNGERPIFPSSLALQKRVHAVRQYRQMERLRNIIFGGYWANMMPNPLKAPAPPPPLSDHLFFSEFLLPPIILVDGPLKYTTKIKWYRFRISLLRFRTKQPLYNPT